jgi:phosphate transport system permease protein
MNNIQEPALAPVPRRRTIDAVNASLKRRYARERRFRRLGAIAVALGLSFVLLLFGDIVYKGHTALTQTYIRVPIVFDPALLDPDGKRAAQTLAHADYLALAKASLRALFPEVVERSARKDLYSLISPGAPQQLRALVRDEPGLIGTEREVWLIANDDIDMLEKGQIDRAVAQSDRRVKDRTLVWVDRLSAEGRIERRFNTGFFVNGTSREPELAGIAGALMGTFYTLVLTLILAFPVGVGAAIYLEELSPKNRLTDLIEVNINNLAAVPSIVFGLLGLAVFINFFGVPRSTPLVGHWCWP